jgi:predicted nucleic acid-binding protein
LVTLSLFDNPVTPPGLVLDTNVVLDWLLFRDPGCAGVVSAIESGTVQWLATPALRDECAQVIARGFGSLHRFDPPAFWAAWEGHAQMHPPPSPRPSGAGCRCTDPDDQKFIDFALHSKARWLLSRDKAVLALARPALRLGLLILPPHRWRAEVEASP